MNNAARTLALVALLSPLATTAQADALPKEVQNLSCLEGTWTGTGTLAMGKQKVPLHITWTCKSTAAKYGVVCDLDLTGIPGLAHYRETDLFGYEPNTRTYHWFSVTNGAETHDHVARLSTSNKIRFTYRGKQDGKPFREVIDWEFLGKPDAEPTGIKLRSESFVGNKSTSVMMAEATKR